MDIFHSTFAGDTRAVLALLEQGADVNAQSHQYGTVLHAAIQGGNKNTVRLVLNRGADVNAQGGTYGTALQAAALRGHTEIVQLLLDRDAEVNAQGGTYGTALKAAALKGHTEIVQLLLDRDANVNIGGGTYGTALQAAALRGNLKIVQLLLDKDADIEAQTGSYGSALQAAALRGHTEIVRLLLDRGANVNAQGGDYGPAFEAAALEGMMETMQAIFEIRGSEIQITENVLELLVQHPNAVQLMASLVPSRTDEIVITEKILLAVANHKQGNKLMRLLLESKVKISDNYTWLRELGMVGYTYKEVIEIFLEENNSSPWIYFEPNTFPHLQVQPDRHIEGCCHQVTPKQLGLILDPRCKIERSSTILDHQEVMDHVQERCGLGGIRPITRTVTDWVGSIKFDHPSNLSVSYKLRSDKSEAPPGTRGILSRIHEALQGMYLAAALVQTNNFCCNSFTVLKETFQASQPTAEIISISFEVIINLIKELKRDIHRPLDFKQLLFASKTILRYVWSDIPQTLGDSSPEQCLHLCALAVQFLCLGFVSYCQAHIDPLRFSFLNFFAQKVTLDGCQDGQSYPVLIAELVDLTCLGGMTRKKVLIFRVSKDIEDKSSKSRFRTVRQTFEDLGIHEHESSESQFRAIRQGLKDLKTLEHEFSESQFRAVRQGFDVLGKFEDILDTWGPGNPICQDNESRSPFAIKIGDGFIFTSDDGKLHWAHDIPHLKELREIDLKNPLLIGSLVTTNGSCMLVEAEARMISANLLEELGTSRSHWTRSQRQLALQGGQYVVLQAAETWNKQIGIPAKDRALAYPPSILIQYLDHKWGVEVSYCTGVAKRVLLGKLVASLLPHFSAELTNTDVLKEKLKDEMLPLKEVHAWLQSLNQDMRVEIINVIFDILDTLRHTGLDSTDTYLCVAWPFDGNTTQCFKVPLESNSAWAKFLADSHDCATFAYITMECYETTEIKCSGFPTACQDIYLLETTEVINEIEAEGGAAIGFKFNFTGSAGVEAVVQASKNKLMARRTWQVRSEPRALNAITDEKWDNMMSIYF